MRIRRGLTALRKTFTIFSLFIMFPFTTVLSLSEFSHGNFGSLPSWKASRNRVALPNLQCKLGLLVFLKFASSVLD